MEPYPEIKRDARLTPVQQGVRRGLNILFNIDDLAESCRIDDLMRRLAQTK